MTKPDRASAIENLDALLGTKIVKDKAEDLKWETLIRQITNQNIIPIISNSVRNDRIFDISSETGEKINHIISRAWAKHIGYPLPEKEHLEKVANFNRVKHAKDDEQAKTNYLTFLKNVLLLWANQDSETDLVESLQKRINKISFSDMVEELDYPRFKSDEIDPYRTLAKLPIKIYITTSYYDFLERALITQDKNPKTQICFWSGVPTSVTDEHRTDYHFKPSVNRPLVYHIHGFEKYPRSIVLSEDDHLDFLVKISQDSDTNNPTIPLYIWEALASEAIMLLGYRLHDWDFRTLFRGVINARHSKLRLESLVLQLDPDQILKIDDIYTSEARNYLNNYFEPSTFRVIWQEFDNFINELWTRYDKDRKS